MRRLKPDPLNLSVNTGVGKQKHVVVVGKSAFPWGWRFFVSVRLQEALIKTNVRILSKEGIKTSTHKTLQRFPEI